MFNRTATLSLLLLGLLALMASLGCSGSGSPVLPDADNVQAVVDLNDGTSTEGTREVADGSFSGVMTDSNGDPLAWTEIYLDGEIAGWTEEDGSFTIYGVEEELEYQLEARIDDEVIYQTSVTPVTRNGQEFGDPDPEIERGTVWGFVHDQVGPVPHALVVVFNHSENFGADFTDDEGYYYIPDAPAGPGIVIGFAPEHATGKDTVMVIAGGEIQKNLFLPKKPDFGMVGGQVVTGPLTNLKPIPHARVELQTLNIPDAEKRETFTNHFGVYRFFHVAPGPHELWANAPCFNEGHRFANVHLGRNLVSFHLEPAGCGGVEGQVTAEDGEPIPQAIVRLIHPNPDDPDHPFIRWEITGPLGFYRFDPVPPGQYHIDCGKPGYIPYSHPDPVLVFPDQFTVLDIVLLPE